MILLLAGVLTLDGWLERSMRHALPPGASVTVGLPMTLVFLLLTALAFLEMARLCAACDVLILGQSGFLGSAILATAPFWLQSLYLSMTAMPFLLIAGFILLAAFAEQMIRFRTQDAIRRIACTLLTVFYLGIGGATILQLRIGYGVPMLVLFLAAVKCTDIGAYFTGSFLGRHKMIPWLSPGKSWEGLAGGAAAAILVSVALAAAFHLPLTLWQAAVFGAIVGLAGQFGDLCESLMKRSAGIKDSGALVPGFGGVLDILDSPLLAAPVSYLVLQLLR